MTARGPDLDPLYEILGHRFADPQLLAEALTHPSAHARRGPRQSYERLEFLGDRVLGLVVAELLWRRFPDEAEGELTRRQTGLVRRESLVEVARTLGLGQFVILSPGEAQAGAHDNPSVLADTCEAVIAALYLDGGLEAARDFVHRCWEPLLQVAGKPPRDPKTALQEWAQGRGRGLPVYETVSVAGPAHRRVFTVTARVEGAEPATASGSSKRAAETAAAAELIARLASEQTHSRSS
ncbi:MAG TPA: ribonuclease III [Stellaceae bacterium]|nr:ribonuclease III [Stellaceae bacterium]